MYYIIKIRISLNYADVNFTMNSFCNETVKRYISSVVINLSASPRSTTATQYCAKGRDRLYKESHCKLLGLLETKCVKGEAQLVFEGKLPATLVLYASPLGDRPVIWRRRIYSKGHRCYIHFVLLAIFYSGCGQQNHLKTGMRNYIIHF